MHNLIFGLKILAIGLLIVMSTLLILALILIDFKKLFYKADGKKQLKSAAKKTAPVNNPAQTGCSGMDAWPQPAPEIACTESKAVKAAVRPEIIAATIGALLFALEKEKPNCLVVGNKPLELVMNTWALAGRARLLNLRQDFALRRLLRRGMYK
ncbi:MAG: hypothetical protein C4554_10560 [Dethiobacter sp.]|jgi:hypothetical protein|nr:MAG: hypothetical protein C4554_10560 [Dethiobacter sp.]